MSTFHEGGEPVNDGEREVLRLLRDELPEDWHCVSNFALTQGSRSFECDAVAISPEGWAYLIETKAWSGVIRGNDETWILPPLVGTEPSFRKCPLSITEQKARVLASMLREEASELKRLFTQPLVVLVSDEPPELDGRCREHTVLVRDVVETVQVDPRPSGYRKKAPPPDAAAQAAEILSQKTEPLTPTNTLGNWSLIEQIDAGPLWDIWAAVPFQAGEHSPQKRLKSYRIDPLLVGEARDLQIKRTRRDLDALERLSSADGSVPPIGAIEDVQGSFIVVTEWPKGESLASVIAGGQLESEDAQAVLRELLRALATVHELGIVHRNLNPSCAHLLSDARVVLTDFDYARIPTKEGEITEHLSAELAGPYSAPEIAVNPEASKASDVWSAARIGLELFDNSDADLAKKFKHLPDRWVEPFKAALSDEPGDRPPDAGLFAERLDPQGDTQLPLFDGYEPNDVLDGRWVVRDPAIETGGITQVYHVFDSATEHEFAAKFIRDQFADSFDAAEEYNLLFELPDHPGIVKPEFPLSVRGFRREGRSYERKATCLLTRWVDGDPLHLLLAEGLPALRCIDVVLDLCESVEHLHDHDLLHRDLKPHNVIVVRSSGKPRLVDFNVSNFASAAGKTATGTPPYRPPDHDETGWQKSSDVYALVVILCELLAGHPLGHDAEEWAQSPSGLPKPLLGVLRKGMARREADRFATVRELEQALQAVKAEWSAPDSFTETAGFPEASNDDLARLNYNPYQERLVGLFSQSSTTNAGTRGLDDFAQWAYVDTLIDQKLLPEIVSGLHRLVLITGNAGDGKTAFIQMLEDRIQKLGGDYQRRPDGNGATLLHDGRTVVTNWDGSQDEGETENDDVLAEFLESFAGNSPTPDESVTRVLAVNEGRLLDFVSERQQDFSWLSSAVREFFLAESRPENGLVIVNLNLRALTGASDSDESMVHRLVDKFVDPRIWAPCESCAAFEHCYARSNATMLRDPVLGHRAAERIRQTFDTVRLRRKLHITMRDLRSALAYVIAGNRTCDEIVKLVESADRDQLLRGHTYNAIFAASNTLNGTGGDDGAGDDRLLAAVGPVDVAKTANPEEDAAFWASGADSIRPDPEGLKRSDRDLIDDLRERIPVGSEALSDPRAHQDLLFLQASLRRKSFLEREDSGWLRMYPFQRLDLFKQLLESAPDRERDRLTQAISRSEGLHREMFANRLAVRLASDEGSGDRSFVLHNAERFRLAPVEPPATEYLEYAPDTLRITWDADPSIYLDVDLDLFETLVRIHEGFTPSREELRGAWLNLRIFKERLAAEPTESLVLSSRDETLYEIHRIPGSNAIGVQRTG